MESIAINAYYLKKILQRKSKVDKFEVLAGTDHSLILAKFLHILRYISKILRLSITNTLFEYSTTEWLKPLVSLTKRGKLSSKHPHSLKFNYLCLSEKDKKEAVLSLFSKVLQCLPASMKIILPSYCEHEELDTLKSHIHKTYTPLLYYEVNDCESIPKLIKTIHLIQHNFKDLKLTFDKYNPTNAEVNDLIEVLYL